MIVVVNFVRRLRVALAVLVVFVASGTVTQSQAEQDSDLMNSIEAILDEVGRIKSGSAGPQQDRKQDLIDYIEEKLGGQFKVVDARLDIRPNIHEVLLEDGTALYVIGNSDYFVLGDLWRFGSGTAPTNITDNESRAPLRVALVSIISDKDLIIFSAVGERKASITVFTDVDCGYCRKLHQEVPELNNKGVEVRYAAFPRAGPNSPVADKMVNAWCSPNRQLAITRLKRGESIEQANCVNTVAKQYEVGQRLGITGTPSIVSEDGKFNVGFLTAAQLLEWLQI